MTLPRLALLVPALGAMVLGVGAAAQNYPNKPVRIVASEAGGGNDFVARQIVPGLTGRLGQQVIVDNRGLNAPEVVARAQADAYTLLINGGQLWLLPFLRKNVAYDPVKDFSPITLVVSTPGILVVHPSVPAGSVKELIVLAKARPGGVNYASGAMGALPHLAAELFKGMAGINIVHIPYKGNGPAINGLIGGEVQLMFATSGAITPHIKSGRVRALAVTSGRQSALFPDLPTIASSLPGFEAAAVTGILAPARTPPALIRRLYQEIVQVLDRPETKERFLNAGIEVVGSSPEEFAAKIKSEMARLGKVITDAGIRED